MTIPTADAESRQDGVPFSGLSFLPVGNQLRRSRHSAKNSALRSGVYLSIRTSTAGRISIPSSRASAVTTHFLPDSTLLLCYFTEWLVRRPYASEDAETFPLSKAFHLSPLLSVVIKSSPLTPLESALTKKGRGGLSESSQAIFRRRHLQFCILNRPACCPICCSRAGSSACS